MRQLEMQKKRYLWGTLTADKIIEALEEVGDKFIHCIHLLLERSWGHSGGE
jgi:hypothetical protein